MAAPFDEADTMTMIGIPVVAGPASERVDQQFLRTFLEHRH
jgi:hypothetical protein